MRFSMSESTTSYIVLALMFAGLVAWNLVDEPSRELWLHGNTKPYADEWMAWTTIKPGKPSAPGSPSAAPSGCPCTCSCTCP
jgi:hypothetical protein